MTNEVTIPEDSEWFSSAEHRAFLLEDAQRQLSFFRKSLDVRGGFHVQDFEGNFIADAPRELHATTRMVHSYAIAHLAGFADTEDMIDHGMSALWKKHRDMKNGGYVWTFSADGDVIDGTKLAYGHAFVLLAAASAKMVEHPDADRLMADVLDVIETHFWDRSIGRMKEEYSINWERISAYRGMNANMHTAEALLSASEATGDMEFARRARGIFDFFVGDIAARHGWRLPEHFTENWEIDYNFEGNPMFRPKGATPGHSFELSRLMLQLRDMQGGTDSQLLEWANALYEQAIDDGWSRERNGFYYTVDPMSGKPLRTNLYWWPVTEAIGAAGAMIKAGQSRKDDYRNFWAVGEKFFIDKKHGGWFPEIDAQGKPSGTQFTGKPDIYHSLQAALFPLTPGLSGMAKGLREINQPA